ncbi:MAG: type II toxin-antitoxin system prevent-host-death family antitoxin [Thermoanaerobacteraceae bacterium]|nr:type II toxin-antitoxin system prevent-host-death family antitoxin [Thermoanaerobacteraceae bacterium]
MSQISKHDLRNIINKLISVSDLSRGMASKIIQRIGKNKEQYIVVKNNKPEAVIMSINEYIDLMEAKENFELLQIAQERTKDLKEEDLISFEEILEKEGLTKEELNKYVETVEIE